VVGIDEAQFFDESIVDIANQLANSGIRVVLPDWIWIFWDVLSGQCPI
jgi:thymidine kinase